VSGVREDKALIYKQKVQNGTLTDGNAKFFWGLCVFQKTKTEGYL